MSTPPKVVRVDLLKQSNKYRTSPPKKKQKPKEAEVQEFSFSEDHKLHPSPQKSPPKSMIPPPLAKKLFDTSPSKKKLHQTSKHSPGKSKQSIEKIRQKYRMMNPNYQKIDETDMFFKRSIEKLKRSFFKNDRNSKQTTKKILKEIGKYAQHRSKNKPKKEFADSYTPDKKYQNIPVEFYGFKEDQNFVKTKRERQQLEKGTYLNFQKAYELSISGNNEHLSSIDFTNENVHYLSNQQRQSRKKLSYLEDHEDFQSTEKDPIGQKEIDIICQIFELCNKCNENQKITIRDLYELIEQLQRLYLIQIAQNCQQKPHKAKLLPQIRFYNLLKQFEEDLRVIFYRKKENNIYDTLYYLKQTNHLQLVCEDFQKIKNCLDL